jgi:hypothetical protein
VRHIVASGIAIVRVKERLMEVLKACGNGVIKFVLWILSIVLVLVVWYKAAPLIVELLDINLRIIKAACNYLPTPYNAMSESALRGALAADKAMLFAEGTIAVRAVFFVLKSLFVRPFRRQKTRKVVVHHPPTSTVAVQR